MEIIEFKIPKKVILTIKEEESLMVNQINITEVIDNGISVIATLSLQGDVRRTINLPLWEGDLYTEIGNWTDIDVENRILELI